MLESLFFYLGVNLIIYIAYAIIIKSNFNKRFKTFLIILILLFLSIFVGLRFNVGTDYENYVRGVTELDVSFVNFLKTGDLEISIFFIRLLSNYLNFTPLFFILTAFLTLFFIHLAIQKFLPNDIFGMFIYLFTFFPDSLNLVRQMVAVSIVLLALAYIKEEKRTKAILLILLATTFHATALLTLLFIILDYRIYLPILKNKTIKGTFLIIAIILIPIVVFNLQSIISFLNSMGILTSYSRYAIPIQTSQNRDIYLKVLIVGYISFYSKKLFDNDKYNFNLLILLIIGLMLTFSGFNNPFIKRLSLYFDIVNIILISKILYLHKLNFNRYFTGVLIVLYSLSKFLLVYYYLGHNEIFPFKLIL
jgi:hypothetical protein